MGRGCEFLRRRSEGGWAGVKVGGLRSDFFQSGKFWEILGSRRQGDVEEQRSGVNAKVVAICRFL